MSALLQRLAQDVGAHERTLRRAVAQGTIHARRTSVYGLELADAEEQYVRNHWSELSLLRSALRTEPSVECAVLFGSAARGDHEPKSDFDILVWMRQARLADRHALARRLTARVGRNVQVTALRDARRSPSLLLAVMRDGRVLVDRERRWPQLTAQQRVLRRRSEAYRRGLEAEVDEARNFFARPDRVT